MSLSAPRTETTIDVTEEKKELGIVHIRVGTVSSNWYTTACGKTDGSYGLVVYSSRHLATCEDCMAVFVKSDKEKE